MIHARRLLDFAGTRHEETSPHLTTHLCKHAQTTQYAADEENAARVNGRDPNQLCSSWCGRPDGSTGKVSSFLGGPFARALLDPKVSCAVCFVFALFFGICIDHALKWLSRGAQRRLCEVRSREVSVRDLQ